MLFLLLHVKLCASVGDEIIISKEVLALPDSTICACVPPLLLPQAGKLAPGNIAAASVNRRRKEDKIAQENLALYQRLQGIKPSRDVQRNTLEKDFQAAQNYGANARKFRAPPVPEPIGVRRQQGPPSPTKQPQSSNGYAAPADKPAAPSPAPPPAAAPPAEEAEQSYEDDAPAADPPAADPPAQEEEAYAEEEYEKEADAVEA